MSIEDTSTHHDQMAAVREGLETQAVRPAVRAQAAAAIAQWLTDHTFRSYRPQVCALIEHGRWAVLLDSFYQSLPFGTGGRRGPVGIGPNRFNPYTLGTSVQGHANFLRRRLGPGAWRVVVACDVREFHDIRGELVEGVANPVLGLSSRDFAHIAAEVYAASGFEVVLPPAGEFLSTPELSFSIRHLGAVGGLQISASHNHPDDNGGKFYTATGGQEVPPRDQTLADEVVGVEWVERMSLDRARAAGQVQVLPAATLVAYREAVLRSGCAPHDRDLRVVFTNLHGTGIRTVVPVLRAAGFAVDIEPTQAAPNGRFPAVPHLAPNPEVESSLAAAVAHAESVGADIVMACDPDADRLGVCARARLFDPSVAEPSSWRFFSGNEIAALVVYQALRHRNPAEPPPVVVQTEVTSRLVRRVAELYRANVVDDLLVGFKYIGEVMDGMADSGVLPNGTPAPLSVFTVGAEESHGVLVTPELRDKDAAGGALLIAELAAGERRQGRTLVDTLDTLQRRTGGVCNKLVSLVLRGATGQSTIDRILSSLRQHPPQTIGPWTVQEWHDRRDPQGPMGPVRSATDGAARNVLVYSLTLGHDASDGTLRETHARAVFRPSGTEPKLKLYLEVSGTPAAPAYLFDLERAVRLLADNVVQLALQRGDITLPLWATRIHDLVNIDDRVWFVEHVWPEVLARIHEPSVVRFVDKVLLRIGSGAHKLFLPGVEAWAATSGHAQAAEVLAVFARR